MKDKYQIVIIGTGPAGLSAALSCQARGKDFLIVGPRQGSKKLRLARKVDNYLGLASISGEDLNDNFLSTIHKYGMDHIDSLVKAVYSLPDGFYVELATGQMFQAKALVLATGVNSPKKIPGEEAFLGSGISYCATCDANLYRDKEVCLLGYSQESLEEAKFLSKIAKKVKFLNLTNTQINLNPAIEVLYGNPLEFKGQGQVERLVLEEGEIEAQGFFIIREEFGLGDLVPGLELDKTHVKVDKDLQTNLPGLFACGDLVGQPYQIMKACGQGNVAGLNASRYCDL